MEAGELISLAMLVIAFIFMLVTLRRVPGWKYFVIAFIFPVITGITTVAEGFIMPELMNNIEHGAWALGAVFFCWAILKCTPPEEGSGGQ